MPETPEVPLTGLVWRLSMRWRASIDRAIAPLGLTHAQYSVLVPLRNTERAGQRPSQRKLAESIGLEPLYVSKLARALEQAGLLERVGDPADSRAMLLALTERGRDVVDQAMELVLAIQAELTAPLGGPASQDTQQLLTSLRRLLETPAAPVDESRSREKDGEKS
jgi:DNA-binding MarR family transcriptional regulator